MIVGKSLTALGGGGLKPEIRVTAKAGVLLNLHYKDSSIVLQSYQLGAEETQHTFVVSVSETAYVVEDATNGKSVEVLVDAVAVFNVNIPYVILASALDVGTTVKLMENGVAAEYLVVEQGIPSDSSLYDASCNGCWLLRKDIYEGRQWHSSNVNNYESSTIHSYLNNTFLNLFGDDIQSAIKQVKIPYRAGSGTSKTVTSGSKGLSSKVFLLSTSEINYSSGYAPTSEGVALSYFSGCYTNKDDPKRVATKNGSATKWWLRSPYCNSTYGTARTQLVTDGGGLNDAVCSGSYGIRPCLIVLPTAEFDEATLILKGVS